MISESQIRNRLDDYLSGNESLDSFSDWLSRASASINYNDNALSHLVASLQNRLDVYFDGIINESSLVNELRSINSLNDIKEYEASFAEVVSQDRSERSRHLRIEFSNSPSQCEILSIA